MKIYAPIKETNGVYASVMFVNGVGETNKPSLIKWFKEHGYRVEETKPSIESVVESVLETVKETEKSLEDMTPNELRDWAKANGYGGVIKNIRNKEKLLELIRGE